MSRQKKLRRRLNNIRQKNARKKAYIAESLRAKAEESLQTTKELRKAHRRKLREAARQSGVSTTPVEG